ncbi:porin [Polynucleobacter paneuropaeus]|nr:porin [Polynucleobacter paneuropaeus]
MKKSLFALAAVGAIAGTAQAQSSVTVYGLMDLGYIGGNNKQANAPVTTGTSSTSGVVNNTTYSAFANGAESANRLGFKGNEDLGGGLSAFFTIEQEITPNSANSAATGVNRQTFAGLKKSGLGQFAFGTQYTTIFNAVAASDPGNTNNMMGNVIYDKGQGIAPAFAAATGYSNPSTNSFNGNQNNTSFVVRANNMLSVQSETFAGFQGNAMYVLNNQNTNGTTVAATSGSGYGSGTTNHTAWGLGVNYTWQKLFVTANYQNMTDKAAYTVSGAGLYTAGAPAIGGYGGADAVGTNDRDNQQYYAATYDFGILKAYVQYINRKTMDVNNPNNSLARTAQQIGVRSYITPTIEAWASAGTGKLTVATASSNSNSFVGGASTIGSNSGNFGGFQLGSNYWLSKRTNLYAIFGQTHTSNQNYTLNANPTSYNANSYALGLRHTF